MMKSLLTATTAFIIAAASLTALSAHAQDLGVNQNIGPGGTDLPYYVAVDVDGGQVHDNVELYSGYLKQSSSATEAETGASATAGFGEIQADSSHDEPVNSDNDIAGSAAGGWGYNFTVKSDDLEEGESAEFELTQNVDATLGISGGLDGGNLANSVSRSGVNGFGFTLEEESFESALGGGLDTSTGSTTETKTFDLTVGDTYQLWSEVLVDSGGFLGTSLSDTNTQVTLTSLTSGVTYTPAPVPEASSFVSYGILLVLGGGLLAIARRQRGVA